MAETRDADHAKQMKEMLQSKYRQISIMGVGEALGIDESDEEKELLDVNGDADTEFDSCSRKSSLASLGITNDLMPKAAQFGGLSIPVIASSARRGSIRTAIQTFQSYNPE